MVANKTLNKDINLIERENGYWDYEFQYGDLVTSEDKQSLRNGLIIACLTSWNYLNRQGNPTYNEFGNKAYRELKKKKGTMVEYTIKQYFLEVLNRIRRVHRVVDLKVEHHSTDPNAYNVVFTVEAINDEIVRGNFKVSTEHNLSPSYITVVQEGSSASPTKPVYFTVNVNTEYDEHIQDELIYAYQVTEDGTEVFIKAYRLNEKIPVYSSNSFGYIKVKFKYLGNDFFNPCESDTYNVLSIPFYFIIDENNHLRMIKEKNYNINIWIGEVIEDESGLEYDNTQPNKKYLIPIPGSEDYYKYTYRNGHYYTDYNTAYSIINKGTYGDINIGDLRLFVEDNGGLYLIENLNRTEYDHIEVRI